jgi:diguanylate cyclase (GGDEF)-like protein/PAS domain S-box-containing protein
VHVSRVVAVIVGAVLVVVTAITAVVGFTYDARQRDVAGTDVRRAALRSLTMELDGLVASTRQVAGLFGSSDDVSAAEFATFTQPMLRDGTASAFGWVPRVRADDRAAWEREHHLQIGILDGVGRKVPAPRRPYYDPMVLIQTANPIHLHRGMNNTEIPALRAALEAAAQLGEPQSTPVGPLAGSGKLGIVLYAGVRGGDGELLGSAAGTFRVEQLVQSMTGVLPRGAAFELRQHGQRVGGHGHLGGDAGTWVIDIAGQRWELLTSPAPAGRLSSGIIALLVGSLLTALVLVTLSQLAREAGRATRQALGSEERFIQAFDHAPVGMALLDSSGRHVKANDAMATMLGRSRDSLSGVAPEAIMPAGEAAACHRLVAALLRGDHASFRGDTTLVRADGRRIRAAVHMTLLKRADGEAPILVHATDVTEQRLAERRMKHLADHDPLTGLLNRRGFGAALQSHVAHARRYGTAGALLILDLDGFKAVNDALGHEAGDRLLVQVSAELRVCLRETDVVARLGGDEFAVILPSETLEEASAVAAKITERVRDASIGAAGPTLTGVTVSIGVAAFTGDDDDGDDVLRQADLAMYSAKAAGRDRHAVHGRSPDLV